MSSTRRFPITLAVTLAVALLAAAAPASAQVRVKIPPPTFERQYELDADGLRQWVPYEHKCEDCKGVGVWTCQACDEVDMPNCPECKGTKKAPCRTCAGKKVLPDPLVSQMCAYCVGAGWYRCALCGGFGELTVKSKDGNENKSRCGSCKQKGWFACPVCDGKQHIPVVQIKKKDPSEASLKDLAATREALQDCLTELEAFEPEGRVSKSAEAFGKIFKKSSKKYAPLKDMLVLHETVADGLAKAGAGYADYEATQTYQLLLFKDRTVYLLQYQVRVLDLCTERAEFNESAAKN